MQTRTKHLLHLAALAFLFYLFALTARFAGATIAVAIFLPLGVVFECKFWWELFSRSRAADPMPD